MQAQASTMRRQHSLQSSKSHSLRSSKSGASFIESVATIHLDLHPKTSPELTRRNTSHESERRPRVPPRKTKSSIVNLPGQFQIGLKSSSESEPVEESASVKNRRFTYAASPSRVDQPINENSLEGPSLVSKSHSHRGSVEVSFPPPPPPLTHSSHRLSSKTTQPVQWTPFEAIQTPRPSMHLLEYAAVLRILVADHLAKRCTQSKPSKAIQTSR